MTTNNIHNAEHPYRQIAIRLIENIIEPALSSRYWGDTGVEGEEYYRLEDKIVELLASYKNIKII